LPLFSVFNNSMWNTVFQVKRAAMGLLFPPVCCLCELEIETPADDVHLCTSCRPAFQPSAEVCLSCAAPLSHGGARGGAKADRCWRCIDELMRFQGVAALGVYEGQLALAARLMKLPHQTTLTMTAGKLLAARVAWRFKDTSFDLIAPVPMHWSKRARRGVNPAALLAEEICQRPGGVPHAIRGWRNAVDLLRWNRWSKSQHLLSPSNRRRNLRGACSVSLAYDIKDARILLIDDTLTTGATANEATRALLSAGAASVSVAVVARGIGR